ncbi:hypothetical protein B0A49_11632 [Cryomyces minteri]|uniref:Uncharacterized protein n=1 Tax=Cryomyces minteri TaxID=331657 RepID=A0A4U0WTY7_9PEZI|nr:hypothetical protein B0A49_11632 [Cryomyces minteri]
MAKRAAAGLAAAAARPKKTKRLKGPSKKALKKAATAATTATATATAAAATAAATPRASSVPRFRLFLGSLQQEPSQQQDNTRFRGIEEEATATTTREAATTRVAAIIIPTTQLAKDRVKEVERATTKVPNAIPKAFSFISV